MYDECEYRSTGNDRKHRAYYTFEEMKESFIQRLKKENRCFFISDSESADTIRIDVCAVNPHNSRRSCLRAGILTRACEDILMRMNINILWILLEQTMSNLKGKMNHIPDISKDFILNKAVRDATNILLKPYMPMLLELNSSSINSENKYQAITDFAQKCVLNSQDFLLKMAAIAWNFLNVVSRDDKIWTTEHKNSEI